MKGILAQMLLTLHPWWTPNDSLGGKSLGVKLN